MKKILIIIFASLLALYLLICLGIYIFQKHLIFIPSRNTDPPPGDLNIEEKVIVTADGEKLDAWWMPVDNAEYTLLFLHGNGGCLGYYGERMLFYRELGCSTLAVDYRGYGKSTGTMKKEGDIYEDGRSALKYLTDSLNLPMNKIIIWGWSLGGAVAAEISRNIPVKAVVLEGTFFSAGDIAQINYPLFPVKWLLKYDFMSGGKMSEIKAPVFFMHSREDKTIPFEQGRKLFDACPGKKDFLEISGSHNHGYYDNREQVIHALREFLNNTPPESKD